MKMFSLNHNTNVISDYYGPLNEPLINWIAPSLLASQRKLFISSLAIYFHSQTMTKLQQIRMFSSVKWWALGDSANMKHTSSMYLKTNCSCNSKASEKVYVKKTAI